MQSDPASTLTALLSVLVGSLLTCGVCAMCSRPGKGGSGGGLAWARLRGNRWVKLGARGCAGGPLHSLWVEVHTDVSDKALAGSSILSWWPVASMATTTTMPSK